MSFISNILSFIEELHNNLPPAEAGFYLLEIQGFPPTAFGELHNVIPNPVAETWVVKLVGITINPSAVMIAKIVNIVFLFINNI